MKLNVQQKFVFLTALLLFFCCATATHLYAAHDPAGEIAVISDIQLDDNSVKIKSNKGFIYTLYSANDPYRVTLDIPDMKAGNFSNKIVSDKPGITEIIPHETDSPKVSTKFDIILQNPSSIVPIYSDGTLTLLIKAEKNAVATDKDINSGASGQPAPKVEGDVPNDVNTTEVKNENASNAKLLAANDRTESASGEQKSAETASGEKTEPDQKNEKETAQDQIKNPATEINKIEVKKSGGALKVLITGNGAMVPNVFPLKGRVVVDIPGVAMKASVPSRFSVPLKGMRVGKYKDKTRIVLDIADKTNFNVGSQGSVLEIALNKKSQPAAEPVTANIATQAVLQETPSSKTDAAGNLDGKEHGQIATAEMPAEDAGAEKVAVKEITSIPADKNQAEIKYNGKKISLDFQDADIGPIFRLLADVNGYNLVIDPSVKGKITIKLMNVPWDQALEIILNTFNLNKSVDGNILWIAPTNVFSKIMDEKSKVREAEERSGELLQEVVRVNYASSSDIQAAVTQGKLLSPRGSITVDSRMNTLIIKDTQKTIDKIKQLVKIMDVAKPQVMIEAKIVQVSTDYNEAFGIKWGGTFSSPTWPTPIGGNFSVNTPTATGGPAANVPGGLAGLTIGHANTLRVDLSLSALESVNKAKTLSNPKVLTMDKEKATIQQGSTFYIATVSQAGTQTQPQTATLSLEVTPQITPDGYVQLKVTATDNSLVNLNPPVVDTKSMTTQALVKDGETLVLGGIYTSSNTEDEVGVPGLSKVPIVGWLFKTKSIKKPTKELLIFITPTVIAQQI